MTETLSDGSEGRSIRSQIDTMSISANAPRDTTRCRHRLKIASTSTTASRIPRIAPEVVSTLIAFATSFRAGERSEAAHSRISSSIESGPPLEATAPSTNPITTTAAHSQSQRVHPGGCGSGGGSPEGRRSRRARCGVRSSMAIA